MAEEKTSPIERIFNKAAEMNIPLNSMFELTYRCNLHCQHCYVADPGGKELTTSEVKGVLDELADAGSVFLTFTGGEPLLREDWFETCQYARQKNFAVRVFTNGTLIDQEMAKKLSSLGLIDIGVSIYGATAATHDEVTTVRGSFDRVMSALELCGTAGVKTVLKFLFMRHNLHEYQDVRRLAESLGARFQFSMWIGPRTNGSHQPCSLRLSNSDLKMILKDGFLYPDTVRIPPTEMPDLRGPGLNEIPMCGAGRAACTISPYGDVQPCGMLPIKLGNLREELLSEVWSRSAALKELRDIRMADVRVCRDCRSIGYCGRCPAFAMLEDGDLLGPSSFACRVNEIFSGLDKTTKDWGQLCEGRYGHEEKV